MKWTLIVITICASFLAGAQSKKHVKEHTRLLAEQVHTKQQIKYTNFNKLLLPEPSEDATYTTEWDNSVLNPYKSEPVSGTRIDVRDYINPVRTYKVTSHYGYRPAFGRHHAGVDLAAERGDTIYAAFSGKVRITKFEKRGYGYYIVLRHSNGLETLYAHLSRFLVKPNQYIEGGDPIGLAGSTGRSTGPHLHFEFRHRGVCLNPEKIINFETHTPICAYYTHSTKKGT